jgi:hypothetical protein
VLPLENVAANDDRIPIRRYLELPENEKRTVERPHLGEIKEDTGLRCGGRGKSEISSAL